MTTKRENSTVPQELPDAQQFPSSGQITSSTILREGDVCPNCNKGVMEYDGLLNLNCSQCGYCGDHGVFTC